MRCVLGKGLHTVCVCDCRSISCMHMQCSIADAEGCLRAELARDLGALDALPREIVGRIASEGGRECVRVHPAIRMDHDAALSHLRISRPGPMDPHPRPRGRQDPVEEEPPTSNSYLYPHRKPTYYDNAYHNDDGTYQAYILRLPALLSLTLYNAPTPLLCLRSAAARCTLLRHLALTVNVDMMMASSVSRAEAVGMAAALSQMTALETLHLGGLRDRSCAIAEGVGRLACPGLRALRLVWTDARSRTVPPPLGLGRLTALRRLGLHVRAQSTEDDWPALQPLQPGPTLTIEGMAADAAMDAVTEALRAMPSLASLDLVDCALGVHGAAKLAPLLLTQVGLLPCRCYILPLHKSMPCKAGDLPDGAGAGPRRAVGGRVRGPGRPSPGRGGPASAPEAGPLRSEDALVGRPGGPGRHPVRERTAAADARPGRHPHP